MRVHHLLSGAGPLDAVTNQALLWHRLMDGWKTQGEIFADAIDPAIADRVRPARRLSRELRSEDALLLHYSAYGRRTSEALELPNRLLLSYHNITPADYLWDHEPMTAALCAAARRELPRLAQRVDAAAAVSAYNARELEGLGSPPVAVIPNAFDPERLGAGDSSGERGRERGGAGPCLVFVGRLVPHKRHDLLIRALAHLRRHHHPDARLVCIGGAVGHSYVKALEALARELGVEDALSLPGPVPADRLAPYYRAADAFLCLSAHEGFCIPVLEAMHEGVPVVAHAVGGLPEAAGQAAVLLDRPDPAVAAEAVALVLADEAVRAELVRRGHRQVEAFSVERIAPMLRTWLEACGAIEAPSGG